MKDRPKSTPKDQTARLYKPPRPSQSIPSGFNPLPKSSEIRAFAAKRPRKGSVIGGSSRGIAFEAAHIGGWDLSKSRHAAPSRPAVAGQAYSGRRISKVRSTAA